MNGVKSPGKLHAISCKRSHHTYVDSNLQDMTDAMTTLLSYIPCTITTMDNIPIKGSSWEMAAIMSLCNHNGVYTGVVDSLNIKPTTITVFFGDVPYVHIKDDLYKDLITRKTIDKMSLPRDV